MKTKSNSTIKSSLTLLIVYFLISIHSTNQASTSVQNTSSSTNKIASAETTNNNSHHKSKHHSKNLLSHKSKASNKKESLSTSNNTNSSKSSNMESKGYGVNNSQQDRLFYPTSSLVKFKRIPVQSRFLFSVDDKGKSQIIDPTLRLGNSVKDDERNSIIRNNSQISSITNTNSNSDKQSTDLFSDPKIYRSTDYPITPHYISRQNGSQIPANNANSSASSGNTNPQSSTSLAPNNQTITSSSQLQIAKNQNPQSQTQYLTPTFTTNPIISNPYIDVVSNQKLIRKLAIKDWEILLILKMRMVWTNL